MTINKNVIRYQIIDMAMLFVIPMVLIQIIPGIFCDFGMNIMWSSITCSVFVIILSVFGYAKNVRKTDRHVPDAHIKPVNFFIIAVVLVIFLLIDQVFFTWIRLHVPDPGLIEREVAVTNVNIPLYLIYGLFVAPVAEECLFRIYFYDRLKQHFSWIFSMVAVSIMFGIIHMTVANFVTAVLFGIILTLIFEYTQSIWITTVCHISYNMITLLLTGSDFQSAANNIVFVGVLFFSVIVVLTVFTIFIDNKRKKYR